MPRLFVFLSLLLLAAPAQGRVDGDVLWDKYPDDQGGEARRANFAVKDVGCAYRIMSDLEYMERSFAFLEEVKVHRDDGRSQNATFRERFFPVGVVESRYERALNGSDRVSWVLQEGRQERHDGTWIIKPRDGGVTIEFINIIEAKNWFDQAILNAIQKRTMADIVEYAQTLCGVL